MASYVEIPSPHLCDACASRPLTTVRRHAGTQIVVSQSGTGTQTRSCLRHSLASPSRRAVSHLPSAQPASTFPRRSLTPPPNDRRSGEAAAARACRWTPWSRFAYRHPILTTSGDGRTRLPVAHHRYRCRVHLYRCRRHLCRCRAHLYRCRASIRWFFQSTRLTHRTTYPASTAPELREATAGRLGSRARALHHPDFFLRPANPNQSTDQPPIRQPTARRELMPRERLRSKRVSEV